MSEEDIRNRRFSAEVKTRVPFFRIWCLFELHYAAIIGKPNVIKGGSFRLEESEGQQVLRFEADWRMLTSMYYAIEVN